MEVAPLIFYKTTADFNNTGEVLIYKSLLENLRRHGNVIIDDSNHIQPLFLSRIGVKDEERLHSHTRSSFVSYILQKSICNVFSRKPIYFVTGVGDHKVKGAKKNLFSFCFLLLCRICGMRVLRIGMSISFHGVAAKWSERLLSFVIPHYYVRDTLSLQACHAAGIRKAQLAPDMSWAYQIEQNKDAVSQDVNRVIFSFRDYCTSKKDKEPYRSDLIRAIGVVLNVVCTNPSVKVLFTYQCNQDLQFMTELKSHFPSYQQIEMVPELITLENANDYYGQSQIVLSNRLHVLLLSYKYGALPIGLTDLTGHKKIQGIFRDNGLDSLLIDIHQVDTSMVDSFQAITEQRNEYLEIIKTAEQKNRATLQQIFSNIFPA